MPCQMPGVLNNDRLVRLCATESLDLGQAERREVRDTLLRISGALQVLREELGAVSDDARVAETAG